MHWLRKVVITYLVVTAVFAFIQRRMMYPASQELQLPVAAFPELEQNFHSATDVEIKTPDNFTIRGWHLQAAPAASDRLILLLHGNGGHRAHRGHWYTIAKSLNSDVLAMDYHGYGDSEGSPTETTLMLDAEAAWSYAVDTLKYQSSQIVIVGESLGGGVAVQLAAVKCGDKTPPAAVVLVATFSSMLAVASKQFRWLPVQFLLLDRYRSDKAIPLVTCPVLQFHGDRDGIIPLSLGQQLHDLTPANSASGVAKQMHVLQGAGHNDILHLYGRFIRDQMVTVIR